MTITRKDVKRDSRSSYINREKGELVMTEEGNSSRGSNRNRKNNNLNCVCI